MVKHCCWGNCRSDDRYKDKKYMHGVFFIPFPKPVTQLDKCKTWVSVCGRKNWSVANVNKHTYICSRHFIGGNGPTADHPNPVPASGTAIEKRRAEKRARPYPRQRSSVPVTNKCKKGDSTDYDRRKQPSHQGMFSDHSNISNQLAQQQELQDSSSIWKDHDYTLCNQSVQPQASQGDISTQTAQVQTRDVGTQTDIVFENLIPYQDHQLQNENNMRRHLVVSDVTKDDSSCKFFTGLTIAMLSLVFGWLKKKAENMSYWCGADTNLDKVEVSHFGRPRSLSLWQEFVLTLLRLRRGYDNTTIGRLFGISSSSVSRIFFTWICLMSHELKFLVSWPSREQCRRKLPKCFKWFPRTRCVIDCTLKG